MRLFPSYETTFSCDCSLQEATERIAKAAAWKTNELKIKKACYCAGTQKFILHFDPGYRNSFVPVISLEIKETEQGVSVSAIFSLHKIVEIGTLILCAFALLFGAIGLFAAFSYVSSWVGLRFSVKRPLEALHYALTGEFAKHLPSVHLC